MSSGVVIQLVAILIAMSCSLLGVFLVLKTMAMLTDAITHTVLLGIVLSFFFVHDMSSPVLIFGASIVGVLTVYFVELLTRTRLMKEDAAIGIVMSSLFSLAVFLISKYTANIHLDVDAVFLGEIAFTPYHKMNFFTLYIPKAIITGSIVLFANICFVKIFFKELKISIFDSSLAASLGLMPNLIHYLLMTMVSITSVIAFEAVGAILLISLMIGPAITAYLISKDLKKMIFYSMLIGVISSLIGYHFAIKLDVSIPGFISVVIGIVFITIFILKNIYLVTRKKIILKG